MLPAHAPFWLEASVSAPPCCAVPLARTRSRPASVRRGRRARGQATQAIRVKRSHLAESGSRPAAPCTISKWVNNTAWQEGRAGQAWGRNGVSAWCDLRVAGLSRTRTWADCPVVVPNTLIDRPIVLKSGAELMRVHPAKQVAELVSYHKRVAGNPCGGACWVVSVLRIVGNAGGRSCVARRGRSGSLGPRLCAQLTCVDMQRKPIKGAYRMPG